MKTLTLLLALAFVGGALGHGVARITAREPRPPDPSRVPSVPRSTEARTLPVPILDPAPVSIEEFLATSFPPRQRSGEGTIEGTVRNELREPLPGLTVTAMPLTDVDPEADLAEFISRYREREAGIRRTTTDAEGRFRFVDLIPAERVHIAVVDAPWPATVLSPTSRVAARGEHVEFSAVNTQGMLGLHETLPAVALLDGEPVSRAWFGASPWFAAGVRARANPAFGTLTKFDGVRRAYAHGCLASPPVQVKAESSATVTFTLEPCTSLHGRLVNHEKDHILQLECLESDAPLPHPLASHVDVEPITGRFEVIGLSRGAHRLSVLGRGREVVQSWELEITPGYNRVVLERDAPERLDYDLIVDVVDPDGTPVEDVQFFRFSTGRLMASEMPLRSDRGRYWIRMTGQLRQAVEAGPPELNMQVRHDGLGRATLDLDPQSWRALHKIQFPPRAHLDVTVEGYIGSGTEGLIDITLRPADPTWYPDYLPNAPPCPDALGKGRFEFLPVGECEVFATYTTRTQADRVGHTYFRKTMRLKRGENSLSVPVPDH